MTQFDAVEKTFHLGGPRWIFRFHNGYGASVVCNEGSYGGMSGLFELAVLGPGGDITYDTPITSDVIGYLNQEDVDYYLRRIAALPELKAEA